MTSLFVLDIPENATIPVVAASNPAVRITRIGPYFKIDCEDAIVVDRRATSVRHAVWYSCIAGLQLAKITQHDKDALRVEPA